MSADPDGIRLPVKLDATSNGEFAPIPLDHYARLANRVAREDATRNARRAGMDRRRFMISLCGTASTLLAFNTAFAQAGRRGGHYELAAASAVDPALAQSQLGKREFIFDVQGHFIDPTGPWLMNTGANGRPFSFAPKTSCSLGGQPGKFSYLKCLGPDEFVKDVFMDSDTDMMVLSFVPSRADSEPLTIETAAGVQQVVEKMKGSHRLLVHGRVNPNQAGDMERMEELVQRWKISAWKTYTQWGPDGRGFWLSDEKTGIPFIENARRLGVKVICVHKGIPFGRQSYEHSRCDDIGVVARKYPDVHFIVYHSGFVPGQSEGPYDESVKRDGIDSLVRSVRENDVEPNRNVYAELGSTWRFLMRDPDSAAHTLGKLFKYIGESNVLWGTDSIWYGSPQDQIQAFRTFQIAPRFQDLYGYPAITPALRARVFGLNATRPYGIKAEEVLSRAGSDEMFHRRRAYREHPDPHFLTFGPRTRREFLALRRYNGGDPT